MSVFIDMQDKQGIVFHKKVFKLYTQSQFREMI